MLMHWQNCRRFIIVQGILYASACLFTEETSQCTLNREQILFILQTIVHNWVGRISLHRENLIDLKISSPLSYMLVQKTYTYSKACNSLSLYEGLGARVRPIWPNVFFKISFFTVTVMGDKVIHYYCTIIF